MKPRKFTLVCYPGEDDSLIDWLDSQDRAVSNVIKRACLYYLKHRDDIGRAATQAQAPDFTLEDIRQVVEASLAGLIVTGQTAHQTEASDPLTGFDDLAE